MPDSDDAHVPPVSFRVRVVSNAQRSSWVKFRVGHPGPCPAAGNRVDDDERVRRPLTKLGDDIMEEELAAFTALFPVTQRNWPTCSQIHSGLRDRLSGRNLNASISYLPRKAGQTDALADV